MTTKISFKKRVISALLSVAIILSALPLAFSAAAAGEDGVVRAADPSTLENWHEFFYRSTDDFDTADAGGIWTDKSVLADNEALKDVGITTIDNPSGRGFLTVLSAIGSNMTVKGKSDVATDTVLVLDTSGSMGSSAVSAMVEAANISIDTLLEANPQNRIAVVFYANSTTTFLPLDHYTTDSDGIYLNASWGGGSISLDNDVRNSGNPRPSASNRDVTGGTYMARGLHQALSVFNAATLGDETRKPIIVFMTDGAPTRADTDYTNPPSSGNNDLGNGTNTTQSIVFATELAASYVKESVSKKYEDKYGTSGEALFYTVGMTGGANSQYSECVLDPVNENTTALANLWDDYDAAAPGEEVVISGRGGATTVEKLTSTDITLSEAYVNLYIAAASENELVDAFEQVVADISLQTTYYPTLVEGSDAAHSGFISFVDKMGRYMKVTGLKGLIINNKHYDGSHMAHAFFDGELGTVDNPTDLGDNLIWSLMERLNIDVYTARALIASAYEAGQLYYKDNGNGDIDFSNYFGWYSDENSNFLGFWSEDTTAPANAKYINKSYLYLGENDAVTGIRESEMMYATIRVRETIATGEQEVNFAVPASLVPTVTYSVTLDEQGNPTLITTNAQSVSPIRLVYETELDSRINKWTAGEVVDNEYVSHVSPGGKNFTYNSTDNEIYFYNNKWDFDGQEGYGTYNTYSYFRPSYENNRHYYQEKVYLYVQNPSGGYELYSGTKPAAGDGRSYFYGATVYAKTGATTYEKKTVYEQIINETLAAATAEGTSWYIPENHVRRAFVNHPYAKTANNTETLGYYASPYFNYSEEAPLSSDAGHESLVGVTLANNGRITVTPERGIKLVKELEAGTTATDEVFTFEIVSSNKTAATREAYKIKADGTVDNTVTSVTFDAAGEATVKLLAGETIYIGDMDENDTVTVTELVHTEYTLKALTVDGVAENDNEATVTLTAVDMPEIVFTNGTREKASLNISKHVTHPYGAAYTIPDKKFNITLTMTLEDDTPLANYIFADGSSTNSAGVITIALAHHESKIISGIPDGVKVAVTEEAYAGFTATFSETSGTANDGIVTVSAAAATAVDVHNDYNPPAINGSGITVKAIKSFGRAWKAGDTFTFELQQWNDGWATVNDTAATQEIKIETGNAAIGTTNQLEATFTNVFNNISFSAPGTYYFRVEEVVGAMPGVSYDNDSHRFRVTVADDDMGGSLEITEVVAIDTANTTVTGNYDVSTTITNTYSVSATTANVVISKTVDNPTLSPLASVKGFTFKLKEVTSVTEAVDWSTVPAITDATNENGVIRYPITLTEAGYKYYKVVEVNTGAKGWTYDNTEKTIVISTEDVDNALVSKIYEYTTGNANTVPTDATAEVTLGFTNTYKPGGSTVVINDPEPAAATVYVDKILSGRAMEAGEFKFILWDENNGVQYTTGTTKVAGENDKEVPVIFEKALTFDTVGEYHFSIYEDTSSAIPGVTYDTTKFTFTVTVTDGGEGSLVAEVTVDNGVNDNNEIIFTNTYKAAEVDFTIPTAKKNFNKEIIENEFSFYIQECDKDGNLLGEATHRYADKDGKIVFPTYTYTEATEKYYLIWEHIPTGEKRGITYDEAQYLAKVTVTDNTETGQLEAELTLSKKAAGETDFAAVTNNAIEFTNTYTAADAVITITGEKALEGTALETGVYSFELYLSNAQWQEVKLLDTKTNGVANADNIGAFTFTDVAIKEDTNFIVKEKVGNKKGVTYDTTVYHIAVTVTDNGRGHLVPEISTRTDENVPVDNISFINTYAADASAPLVITGTKVLNGRDLEAGEFKFYMQPTDEGFVALEDADKLTATNAEDGKFSFEGISYEEAGKYYYVISEDTTLGTEHVTFDNTKYYVTVTVTDNTDEAKLEAEYIITKAIDSEDAVEQMVFTNTYSVPTPPTGDDTQLALWTAMLTISGLAVIVLFRKKKEN